MDQETTFILDKLIYEIVQVKEILKEMETRLDSIKYYLKSIKQ